MFRIIIACALLSVTAAAVIPDEAQARIIDFRNDITDGTGNYEFSFETSNGIRRQETGRLINVGAENQFILVEGTYSYTDPEGKYVEVKYRADENGYQELPLDEHPRPGMAFFAAGLPSGVVASLLGK